MKKIFIIIPSFEMTGPIKGAIALANSLVIKRDVTLITVKNISDGTSNINDAVKIVNLEDHTSNYLKKIILYRNILKNAGEKNQIASISMLFSADFINIFCNKYALICSSVRGNLIKIYRMDYGILGLPLAVIHLVSLRKFNKIASMSSEMAKQIKFFSKKDSSIIGNFIDETLLQQYKILHSNAKFDTFYFVFVGSISHRKNPLLLLNAISKLKQSGFNIYLEMVGDGHLMPSVIDEIKRLDIQDTVKVHGHLDNPYKVLAKSHCFILPSYSEGTPRASLEALYIGLPCIMRNVDGNSELIKDGINGFLFSNDDELPNAMIKAMSFKNNNKSLLPEFYSQAISSKKYLNLIES
tara:strand:+ start:3031 stop:4092 length:1062 start_codon:yes stop_codon:yes gene_type:complete